MGIGVLLGVLLTSLSNTKEAPSDKKKSDKNIAEEKKDIMYI